MATKQANVLTQWAPVVLILGVLAFYFYGMRPAAPPPGWEVDLTAAVELAKTSGKKLVLAFHSEGCPPCKAMDRTVLRSEEVQTALRPFVPVRVDAHEAQDVAVRYGVFATPAYVIIQPDGTPIGRADGFISAEQFVVFLSRAS